MATNDQPVKVPYAKESADEGSGDAVITTGLYDDASLLELFKRLKKESFDQRWVFERQWLRDIYYMLNRQWIYYNSRLGEWQDRRLAKWVPRPVTNKCKETVQAIRAVFTAVRIGVNVRPNGQDPQNVSAAATSDELHPLLHEEHDMNSVMTEADWWFLVTGNVFIQSFWDYDPKYGTITVAYEKCLACGLVTPSNELVGAQPTCPKCEGNAFETATNPATGEPLIEEKPVGRGVTLPLSPLELAFPTSYARWSEVPYVIRMRWRSRAYYENNPRLKDQVKNVSWSKSPNDRSMQLFRSLPLQNDLGAAPLSWTTGSGSAPESEGIAEYEVWYKPDGNYPKGLVFRVIGDRDELIIHNEDEALPGPIPYTDAEGNPIFTFAHATYEQVGGRVLGSGALDPIIQKQDQLNQLDSMIQMIIQRMANPVWLEPKGAEIEKFTGEPGLVVKWNPLTAGGQAKPERIEGVGPHGSFFQIREQYLRDIEELTGTFDILKGAKPTGVEAFSAMQLLVERSQSRFSGAFQARGDLYRNWFKFAIELERQFGPDERTKSILTPARSYTFKTFKNAQLQGSVTVVVEDGSTAPKTNLGMRAALEHANQLGMLDMQDPDQQYEGLRVMGLTRLVPSLDVHVQAALQKQQEFEEWVANPALVQQSMILAQQEMVQFTQSQEGLPPEQAGVSTPPSPLNQTPLKWRAWYNPMIHRQEFMKWANSDRIRELLRRNQQTEGFLAAHLSEIEMALVGQQTLLAPQPQSPPSGAGAAMSNSNRESTTGNVPKGNREGAQWQGPA